MFKSLMFFIFETREVYEVTQINKLVKSAQMGDEGAFEAIVTRLRNRIEVHIRKLFTFEHHFLYQESLIVLYECIQQYDNDKCDQFEPYYFYRLKLRFKDILRHRYRAKPIESLEDLDETGRNLLEQLPDDRIIDPSSECEYLDLLERMTPIKLSLSHIEYRVLHALMKKIPIEEIATLEQTNEKTIYNTINRLKHKVYNYLERSN